MRIEEWAVVHPTPDPHAAPETQTQRLGGKVFGHPRFKDGHRVTTSSIRGKNISGEVVTKSGSSYELGEIDPGYEKAFPDAKNRLLDSLPVL